MTDLPVPCLIAAAACLGLVQRRNVYGLLCDGAADGIRLLLRIAPSLIILLAGISMFRASGAEDLLCRAAAPVFSFLGLPPETAPLVFLRPFSGSAALAVGTELMDRYGVNSLIGRTTAVMLGSTETTFYTIAVYFGGAKIKGTRYAVPAALLADLTGFCVAAWSVRLFG